MVCGDAEITSVARCNNKPRWPGGNPKICTDRYFVFERSGATSVVRPGAKSRGDDGVKHVVPKAINWLCAQGKTAYYLVVTYHVTDSNCDTTCNWYQIYDLSGKPMIGVTTNRRTDDVWKNITEKRLISKDIFAKEAEQVEQRLGIDLAYREIPHEVFWTASTYIPIKDD